ncbi:MAG TPA: baseplate J/gp47 family protein [Allosphingosinicella sp.]|jgi:phage-related baseplate assembly protein
MPDYASTSTAVDLSRLPPPTIIEPLSYAEIRAELLADLRARDPSIDVTVESDPLVKQAEVFAYRELLLRQTFNDRARQLLVAFATGANLDHLGVLFGVGRLVIDPGDAEQGIAPTMEADDALRERIVLAPESYSVAGPEQAYIFHAASADAAVADASAVSPAPGEVVVTVLARAGNGAAPAPLLAKVQAALSKPVRPLGDAVTVASAQIIPFAVEATLYTYAGPDTELVLTAARARVETYLAENRKLGRDITVAGITAALFVAGVQNVALPSPAADVLCSLLQAGHCTAIDIGHGGYAG